MADKEQFTLTGKLTAVEVTEAPPGAIWKKRATLKITEENGNKYMIGTFEDTDIDMANSLNGKTVTALFTKSKDEKYNNLNKAGIKAAGVQTQLDAPVEKVPDSTPTPAAQTPATPTPTPANKSVQSFKNNTADGYWERKFDWDVANFEYRQTKIIRQNSWTQAQTYIANMLKAAELGFIAKDELTKEEFTIKTIKTLAHTIEEDINRAVEDKEK